MNESTPFVDIHCHLIPGIDDGAKSWNQSFTMAQMAVADGIGTIIATPHQLGAFAHNRGDAIRAKVQQLQAMLKQRQIPLTVLPGADVRIDSEMITKLRAGDVLTLADRRRHVLLELPHELYFSIDSLLTQLHSAGFVAVLSHPERNQGILKSPGVLEPLAAQGCLMQVTAGSLTGSFGPDSQQLSQWMLDRGLVHAIATDGHGPNARRPLMRRAYMRVAQLAGDDIARELCCHNPARIAAGQEVVSIRPLTRNRRLASWLPWRKTA
jgi:protein-tyrosine phosphatase